MLSNKTLTDYPMAFPDGTPGNQELALIVKAWRGDVSLAKAAPFLGLPRRTLEGIEQGRGFRYPDLLMIAMKASKPKVAK